ncbi:hypothetical protein F5883DRAFT_500103 [Diaporthe sp. PMI_573]|nr:hypothetical protein F5883DRAFT_500103 [Diaporthaceae sp. PMI_573]
MQSWNVRFMCGTDAVAGIYQRDNFLRVADVARELELCLVLKSPAPGAESWQPALLQRDARPGHGQQLLVLDKQDTTPFPTPSSRNAVLYELVFHRDSACASGGTHSLGDRCISRTELPTQRHDPRYLEIGRKFADPRVPTVPLRRMAGTKRRSSSSVSVSMSNTTSASPARTTGTEDELPPTIISFEEARPRMDAFRSNVLTNGYTCAFSGMGKSWLPGGVAGPGIEAAHVVPQLHWHTYPCDDTMRVADINKPSEMKQVWLRTWTFSNGLPMLSHLHKCFDARLISIHPETRRIRAFADYDILTQYHGQLAHLPEYIDSKALRHHWDMCCLENMRSSWLEQESEQSTVESIPTPRIPLADSVDQSSQSISEPSQQAFLPPPVPNAHGDSSTNPQHAKQASDMQTPDPTGKSQASKPRLHHSSYKLRGAQAHPPSPPSPPSSEPAPERHTLWWFGDGIVDDAAEAEALTQKGWLLRPVDEADLSSKKVQRILRRKQKQRAGGPQLWWFGDEVIENAAEAEALMKQGWLLQPIDEEDDEHDGKMGKSGVQTVSTMHIVTAGIQMGAYNGVSGPWSLRTRQWPKIL